MSIQKFGQYFLEIESPKIGDVLTLDGIDGFDDQTLWNFKKGNKIQFLINPNSSKDLLTHEFLIAEILEDTNSNDWANVRVEKVTTIDKVFKNKPLTGEDDFQLLIRRVEKIWDKSWEMKQKIKNYTYRPPHNHFLTFNELHQVVDKTRIEFKRKNRGLSKIYAQEMNNKSIRVLSVTDNSPESCFVYDIDNVEHYKSAIIKMKKRNQWDDENKFWENIISS